ncbi:glucosamine inositolphosphorylceramide transferase family protein [Aequorivita lipolytica]|uniref:Glucosamine inositolphosphorylceramide transferase 1 N-terminal domain-containing protein n=1 Tax=Aequorivita lipolytica TaxID=153267 RepID=A0A5C6YMH0_9FLAO|nr:hypothetical protein [Aequorivita lipolytica]TXD68594.1 hypothetical protein ESV24_11825 [Aequorivita lipolytica]
MKYIKLFKKGLLWSMGVYIMDEKFNFDVNLKNASKVFNIKKLRTTKEKVHTNADPFLFVKNDWLYLFYESQSIKKAGFIKAYKTQDLDNFIDLGIVLKEDFHLAYPFVFEIDGSPYMIPDSSSAQDIRLYKFEDFPFGLKKSKTLLNGRYWDSSVIYLEGMWYLFTSSEKGMDIFFTPDILTQPLRPHPQNPVCTDAKYERCGGGVVSIDGQLYRLAQDCSEEYGKSLHILKINALDEKDYSEELYRENYLEGSEKWNYNGGHHLSFANFKEKNIIATDGKQNDYFINKMFALYFMAKND